MIYKNWKCFLFSFSPMFYIPTPHPTIQLFSGLWIPYSNYSYTKRKLFCNSVMHIFPLCAYSPSVMPHLRWENQTVWSTSGTCLSCTTVIWFLVLFVLSKTPKDSDDVFLMLVLIIPNYFRAYQYVYTLWAVFSMDVPLYLWIFNLIHNFINQSFSTMSSHSWQCSS